jgi:hypothetical protein
MGQDAADGRRPPRIAAVLSVHNEVELVERQIAHLITIGVDHIIACDITSTDGTADILERCRSDRLSVLTFTTREALNHEVPWERSWDFRAFEALRKLDADWALFLDADDFWLPASGRLSDCAALQHADVLVVERYNVPLGMAGPLMPAALTQANYDAVLLVTGRTANAQLRKELTTDATRPWTFAAILPKVMARPSLIRGVNSAFHDVLEAGAPLRRAVPDDLLIAHLPFTTETRFMRKVASIRATFAAIDIDCADPAESWQNVDTAWHWRRWASLPQSDLPAEFARNRFDDAQITELRQAGRVASAASLLKKSPSAAAPQSTVEASDEGSFPSALDRRAPDEVRLGIKRSP